MVYFLQLIQVGQVSVTEVSMNALTTGEQRMRGLSWESVIEF